LKTIRPYQHTFHEAVIEALNRGSDKQLAVLPVGSGKTFSVVKLIERLGYTRGIWITHTEELIDQSSLAFIRERFDDSLSNHIEELGFVDYIKDGGVFAGGEFKMGLVKADVKQTHGNIVMCSAQSLHRNLHLFDPDEMEFVICDEAHLFMSPTFIKSAQYFNPKLLLGITATDERLDGLQLSNLFTEKVYEYEIKTAIDEGYLCEIDCVRVKTNVSLDKVKTLGGEFNQKELAGTVNCLSRNNLVADSYIKYGNGRQGIFFAVDILHALDLVESFKMKGVNAEAVSSDEQLTGDRSHKIKAYKEGKIDVLVNVNILTCGFDAPNTGIIGCVAPTKSKARYIQQLGRGTRLKDDNYVRRFGQKMTVLDFIDLTTKHNLINCHEIEKEKEPQDRCFISAEKRQKLIEDREIRLTKIDTNRDKDEHVNLLILPRVKLNLSPKMSEPATLAQLNAIKNWGFNIIDVAYTKQQINEIFLSQPASEAQVNLLRIKGYKVDGFVSKAQAIKAFDEINNRKTK